MAAKKLPYVVAPGSIKTALDRIRAAATPDRFTKDYVHNTLQIKGGTGTAIPPFMKQIGFVASDATPTDLYRRFRNPSTGGAAMAEAIKNSYKDLSAVSETFYKLPDKELRNLIVQVTGLDHDNRVTVAMLGTLKNLLAFAKFDDVSPVLALPPAPAPAPSATPAADTRPGMGTSVQSNGVGLNLSYTINLNLPATSDQAVFNAIFKSLKEHLLANDE